MTKPSEEDEDKDIKESEIESYMPYIPSLEELIDEIYEFNKEDLLRTESKNRPTVIPIISVSEIPIEKKDRFYVNFNPKGSRPKQITGPANLRAKTYDEYPIKVAMKVGSLFDDTVRSIERM